jgi:hypothetical protein
MDETGALYACKRIITHLQAVSDRIELDKAPDKATALLVDLGNLKSADALHLGQCIVQIIHEKCGQPVNVGLAVGKFPALVAASTGEPNTVNVVEHPANFLAPVSIDYLPAPAEMVRRLALFGIHTLGQFAALSSAAVFEQFGREGQALQRLAQGQDERPIVPYSLPETLARTHLFDVPVESSLILERVLDAIADDLRLQLQAVGKTSRSLALSFDLESGQRLERFRLLHDEPIAKATAASFQQVLPQINCGVWAVGVELIDLVSALPVQLELFPSVSSEAQRFEARITELAARYGKDHFYTGVVIDSTDLLLERRCRLDRAG